MKSTYLLPLVAALTLSSSPAYAQTIDHNDSILKLLLQCHSVLFSVAIFSKLPIVDNENVMIERIKTTTARISTESKVVQFYKIVIAENKNLLAEITSDSLSASRAQEIKSDFLTSCTSVLSSAETLPNAR
jgi:hypothetical protein